MKAEVVPDCCRICLTKCKKLRSLYKPIDEDNLAPHEMLQIVAGIAVEKIEKFTMLPKSICKNCELSLSVAFEVREAALQSHNAILAFMQDMKIPYLEDEQPESKAISVKKQEYDLTEVQQLEVCTEETTPNFPEKSGDEDQSGLNGQNDMHEEKLEDDEICEIVDSDSYNDEDLQEVHYEELETEEIDFKPHCVEPAEIENNKHDEQKHPENGYEIQVNVNTRKKAVRRTRKKQKPKPKPKSVCFVCDICGNVFNKRGRLTEHRQRHDNNLKFACELCNDKFRNRELLRKHMYSHSGGKPLKCQYCSRAFYYESVRRAHEAVHQGLKPYICESCGKSFSYSHSLKKHELIHANVKLYRCEYCNKDFRLQHHMKQHKETRLHKKAVAIALNRSENHSEYEVDNEDEPVAIDVLIEDAGLLEDPEYVESDS